MRRHHVSVRVVHHAILHHEVVLLILHVARWSLLLLVRRHWRSIVVLVVVGRHAMLTRRSAHALSLLRHRRPVAVSVRPRIARSVALRILECLATSWPVEIDSKIENPLLIDLKFIDLIN
ncbi:hypothetical protein BpHYR1_012232 [Brachionus plicatilis]|uniref:Uncharacterized protein n=1 Tax=Brachionus plicatilis TaxID=10195 RepID=A0A3M7QM56_BRAPC|nr:hypothetical protein BpHYR1_012232 [Brachionus plicatilis]